MTIIFIGIGLVTLVYVILMVHCYNNRWCYYACKSIEAEKKGNRKEAEYWLEKYNDCIDARGTDMWNPFRKYDKEEYKED